MCEVARDFREDRGGALPANVRPISCAKKACAGKGCAAAGRLMSYPLLPADSETGTQAPIRIASEFVDDILAPYKPHARYLKSAEITGFRDKSVGETGKGALISAAGRFA